MNPITFQALAEPHRLEIVELLRDGARPVNEIVTLLHMNQPQVSKHLRILNDYGIVEVHPRAQQRYYTLRPQAFKEIDTWIERYRKLWEERFDRLEALLKDEKKKFKKQKK